MEVWGRSGVPYRRDSSLSCNVMSATEMKFVNLGGIWKEVLDLHMVHDLVSCQP